MPFSSDPRDTVREYAPDAVRRAAFEFAAALNAERNVSWCVRDDNAFDVTVTKFGGEKMTTVIDREGRTRNG